jgi:hypothetical protein
VKIEASLIETKALGSRAAPNLTSLSLTLKVGELAKNVAEPLGKGGRGDNIHLPLGTASGSLA